uniref:antileukoproteinase-like n=1 Tax=Podarcis muralis TaxID=64176 RepID=UPI00109F0F30|nr:antileukoproteinase-like [Podarcis muralis]
MRLTSISIFLGFFILCQVAPSTCATTEARPFFGIKLGDCPHNDAICHGKPVGNRCLNDTQCPSSLKCCPGPCGKTCLQPVNVKPDHCPPDTEQDVKNFNYCNKDDDCKGKQKCCFAFWGSECLDTQKEKPKNCPEKVFKCPKILRGECTHDTQCKGVKKCCFSDCALRCVDPV